MDGLANHFANILVDHGIRRGDLVALYFEKSVEMFVAILATLKAGAGYVPLDPEHPASRIQTIIGMAETAIVLTSDSLRAQCSTVTAGTDIVSLVVDVDTLSQAAKPAVEIGRDDVCYVIYTSGSTGLPKGGSRLFSCRGSLSLTISRRRGRHHSWRYH